MKKRILRIFPRLLPAGALFLPLGTLTLGLGGLGDLLSGLLGGAGGGPGETSTSYNIVKLVQALFEEKNEMIANVLNGKAMAPARPWMAVAAVGLALSIAAVLAGLALCYGDKAKLLAASFFVYAGGALAAILAIAGFARFSAIMGKAASGLASASLNIGVFVLLAALMLNAGICFFQWRAAKERARLAALAAKRRKKK